MKHCIREDSANFIAAIISGNKVKHANGHDVYTYGNMKEKELWEEFQFVMFKEGPSSWLNQETTDERPQIWAIGWNIK